MPFDAGPDWQPIERITAVVRLRWAFSLVHATRWQSGAANDATVVSMTPLTPQPTGTPLTVTSSLPLQRAARIPPERSVLDPNLEWDHPAGTCQLSGPVLGIHLTAKVGRGLLPGLPIRSRIEVTTVLIEPSNADVSAFGGEVADGWQHLLGRHLAFLTRWPIPANDGAVGALGQLGAPSRLATGTAPLCREQTSDSPG